MSDDLANLRNTLDETVQRLSSVEASVEARKAIMRETIHEAVQAAMPAALLSDEEHRWVRLAIKKESQSIEFRRAIIEKSVTSLVWAAIAGIALVFKEYLFAHGWKP